MRDYDNKHVLYRTTDGGASWTALTDPVATPFSAAKMHFTSASTGFALANDQNTVYKTLNGGILWEPLQRDNDFAYLGYSHQELHFFGANQLWAAGNRNFLELSANGGGTPLPKAYFTYDRSAYPSTGAITLENFSNTAHTFKWYVNNTLIATSYNASYTHAPSSAVDSVKLVVTSANGKKDSLTQYLYFYVAPPPPTYTGWVVKQTGINDHFRDVRFFGQHGVIIGDNGLYFTTGGADNPARWKRFAISGSAADSALLRRTKFAQIAFSDRAPIFYIAGTDTVQNRAVLFRLNGSDSSYAFPFVGTAGSRLNSIAVFNYYNASGRVLAVGDNGLMVSCDIATNTATVSNFRGVNLKYVYARSRYDNSAALMSSDSLFIGTEQNGFVPNYGKPIERVVSSGAGNVGYRDYFVGNRMIYSALIGSTGFFIDSVHYFKPADLQFRSITPQLAGTYFYAATNRGIYKLYVDRGAKNLDYQPTSGGRDVTRIWFKQNDVFDTGYAVGPNGLLMQTLNAGGPVKPYAGFTGADGTCVGGTIQQYALNNSGNSCKWYLNGVFLQDWCGGYPQTYPTAGTHEMKLITSNADGVSDTAIRMVVVTPRPLSNLPFTVSDTILCKSERIQVLIRNTQPNFRYELVQQGSGTLFGSGTGNGGQLLLQSDPISQSGPYLLRAVDHTSGCSSDFSVRINIRVEAPRARFVADKRNVTAGERFNLFQRSHDASSHEWSFGSDANLASSADANPEGIFYTTPGQKTLTLVSTSANGCRDTVTAPSLFVYNPQQATGLCYVQGVEDVDYSYTPTSYPTIGKPTVLADNGYLINGYGNRPLVRSRYGNSVRLPKTMSSYIARYNSDGTLKWLQYVDTLGSITASATDGSGNIYLVGYSHVHSWYHFNNGDSMKLAMTDTDTLLGESRNGFILKVDAAGKYLWHAVLDDHSRNFSGYPVQGGLPNHAVFRNGTLTVSGTFLANLSYVRNNTATRLYTLANSTWASDNQNSFLIRVRADGSLVWRTYARHETTNQHGPQDIGVDDMGNTYLVNDYETSVKVFDKDSLTVLDIPVGARPDRSFLVKFDSTGRGIWNTRMQVQTLNAGLNLNHMAVDANGNCYITGKMVTLAQRYPLSITNANGAVVLTDTMSGIVLIKINRDGHYEWCVGSRMPYYGFGYDLALSGGNLFLTGTVSMNGVGVNSFTFTSTNGVGYTGDFSSSEFFIAHYDTVGVFRKMGRSGQNGDGSVTPSGIAIDHANNFIVTGIGNQVSGPTAQYTIFNAPLVTSGVDAFVAHLNPNFCYAVTPPVANAGRDTLVCPASNILLGTTAIAGNSYSWTSSPAGFTSSLAMPTVRPATTTTYYLSVMGPAGNFGFDTVTVSVIAPPVANAGRDTAICSGRPVVLGSPAVSGNTYAWTASSGSFSTAEAMPTVTPSFTTSYFLTVTPASGCGPIRDTVRVTVVPPATPAVTISTPATTFCSGASATFTATPVNGGTAPVYQWQVNGINTGNGGAVFTTASLANNDQVSVIMTSNAACATAPTATSNLLTVSVTGSVVPQVTVSASATNVCAGTQVTFTATAANGGTTPTYQWKINGVDAGSNSAGFSTSALQNNDVVSVVMTSSVTCAAPASATSSGIPITIRPQVAPSVIIQAGPGTICQGSNVLFTATAVNGGPAPQYQWRINGAPVGAGGATFSTAALAPNVQVTVMLTSNADCANPVTVTSAPASLVVQPLATPSVSIAMTGAADICPGATATFTATAANGGSTPSYQWRINGVNAGSNSATFSSSGLVQGDVISVVLTSNAGCLTQATATSNNLPINLLPVVTPSIQIQGTATSNLVVFQSSITNGGSSPAYRWQDSTAAHNWQDIAGASAAQLSYQPVQSGDKVRCRLTSSATCATPQVVFSNAVRVTVDSSGISVQHRAYPNPATTTFTVDRLNLTDNWEFLEIRDAGGVLIATYDIVGRTSQQVNVQGLAAGRYAAFLRRRGGNSIMISFVKL